MELRAIITARWLYRAWYYFRIGYGPYLTFLLGHFSTTVTVYYLAVKNMPTLLDFFSLFGPFATIATAVGAPLSDASVRTSARSS